MGHHKEEMRFVTSPNQAQDSGDTGPHGQDRAVAPPWQAVLVPAGSVGPGSIWDLGQLGQQSGDTGTLQPPPAVPCCQQGW